MSNPIVRRNKSFYIETRMMDDHTRLVTPHGAIDAQAFDLLEETFSELLEKRASRILVDMCDVPTISSFGIGIFISCQIELGDLNGGRLVLVAPQPDVAKVLNITEVDQFFEVLESMDEALAA